MKYQDHVADMRKALHAFYAALDDAKNAAAREANDVDYERITMRIEVLNNVRGVLDTQIDALRRGR